MVKDVCAEAINVVQCLMGKASHYNPFALCERIGISTITDKPLQKDGYLVCSDGLKLILSVQIYRTNIEENLSLHMKLDISLCTKNNYIVAQMFLCLFPRRSIRLVRKKKLTLLQRNYWCQPLNYCHCFPIGRCVFQTFHLLQTILIFLCRMLLSNLFNAQKQQMRYCYAMKAAVSNGIQQMVHRNLKIRFQNAALLILASL